MALTPIKAMRLWNLMYFLAFAIILPYFPVLLERGGLTPSQIGLAFTISNLASSFFSYYMGRLSDRVGRLKILVPTTLLAAFSYLMIWIVQDPILMAALFTLLMIGGGSANTVFTAYSMDAVEQTSQSLGGGFGLIRIWGSFGAIIGFAAGGVLVEMLGLRGIFLVASLLVGSSVLTIVGLREIRRTRREEGSAVRPLALLKGAPGALLLTMTFAFTAFSSLMSFLSLLMINEHGASPLHVSAAWSMMALSEIPGMVYLGRLSDRVGRKAILLICIAALPLRLVITGLSPDKLIVILAQALNSLTFGGLYVVSITYASELVPERMRGAYMGLYGATFSMGGVIGGYLWGSVAEATSYATMFMYAALFSLIPVAMAGLTLRKKEREVYSSHAAP